MALQYWRSRGLGGKHRLATWRGGYHGDIVHTWMSVCGPRRGMHQAWTGRARRAGVRHRCLPTTAREVAHSKRSSPRTPTNSRPSSSNRWCRAGGMRFQTRSTADLRAICDRHGVLLIFDEIATAPGCTGTLFAAERVGVSPDIMCGSAALLTAGYITLAATLCTGRSNTISSGEPGALMHGPTFMANAGVRGGRRLSSCRSAPTGRPRFAARIRAAGGSEPARALPGVLDVRVLGAIGVIEMEQPVDMRVATAAALAHRAWPGRSATSST